MALGIGSGLCPSFEFFVKWYVVEKAPRVIELGVPRSLKIHHRLYHTVNFLIPYQREKGRIYARRIRIICSVVARSP